VGYPLLPLAVNSFMKIPGNGSSGASKDSIPKVDYIGYLRKLEEMLILALMRLGVASGQIEGLTGVWVQPDVLSRCPRCAPEQRRAPAKIAAIGVKVDARGVSRHGFALNVDPDMTYWDGIIGCGLEDYPVVSLADLCEPPPSMEQVRGAVIAAFAEVFAYEMEQRSPLPQERS
jgi:lipoate-protein ligase B